jgi:hypothetical protein
MELLAAACKPFARCYMHCMFPLAAAANESNAFDAVKDNIGMAVVGVIVIVTWVGFRRMLELSDRKKNDKKP